METNLNPTKSEANEAAKKDEPKSERMHDRRKDCMIKQSPVQKDKEKECNITDWNNGKLTYWQRIFINVYRKTKEILVKRKEFLALMASAFVSPVVTIKKVAITPEVSLEAFITNEIDKAIKYHVDHYFVFGTGIKD